jgi:PAS domain S-box-containing protein
MPTNRGAVEREEGEYNGTSLTLPSALSDSGQLQAGLLHLIVKTTSDAIVAVEQDGLAIFWNKGAERTFGWRADEILGKSLDVIVPESHRARHKAGVQRLSEGQEPRLVGKTTIVPAIDRGGQALVIELSLTLWHDPMTGKPAGYAAIMRDVTERQRLEAQRDDYQRKLDEQLAAMEATSDGIAVTDAEGFFVYLNPAHCTMFGYKDASELIGRHWSVIYSDEEAQRLATVAIPVVFGTGKWRGEAKGKHLDGRIIEQEVALVMSRSGGLVCTTRDTGERKRAMQELIRTRERLLLAESTEVLSRAVSGVVHDFANFMAVISASAATLSMKNKPAPPELVRIESSAVQANAILEQFFRPNRAESAVVALDAKSALATVVELTAVTLRPYHSIQLHSAEDGIVLETGETEFLRVMMNLCSNARDSLPIDQAGSIEITLEKFHSEKGLARRMVGTVPGRPSAVITVTDTGCGIEEGNLVRIFEPFHTDKSFGTGLGLVVVSALVAEAGGSVHVRSGSRGTKFQIVWPLSETGVLVQKVESDTSCPLLAGARILVVDDNALVLDMIAAEARKTQAEVTTVRSPVAALELLESDAIGWDVAVLDYDMPEMNGAELALQIRDRWPHLPIILCTALHETEMGVSSVFLDGRVVKSAIARDLNDTLAKVLLSSTARPN